MKLIAFDGLKRLNKLRGDGRGMKATLQGAGQSLPDKICILPATRLRREVFLLKLPIVKSC